MKTTNNNFKSISGNINKSIRFDPDIILYNILSNEYKDEKKQIWNILRNKLVEDVWINWISRIKIGYINDIEINFAVPNLFFKQHIEQNYLGLLKKILQRRVNLIVE